MMSIQHRWYNIGGTTSVVQSVGVCCGVIDQHVHNANVDRSKYIVALLVDECTLIEEVGAYHIGDYIGRVSRSSLQLQQSGMHPVLLNNLTTIISLPTILQGLSTKKLLAFHGFQGANSNGKQTVPGLGRLKESRETHIEPSHLSTSAAVT